MRVLIANIGNNIRKICPSSDAENIEVGRVPIVMECFVALFRYFPDGFWCWMLLGGEPQNILLVQEIARLGTTLVLSEV